MPIALAISAGGSLLGGVASIFGANQQANAAKAAAAQQMQMFQQERADLKPYMTAGTNSLQALMSGLVGQDGGLGSLLQPFNPQNLDQTPGYKFARDQGDEAILDHATATGGVGGSNTLKALMGYNEGLASQTYQQQFQDYMAQNKFAEESLYNTAALGENAAAGVGSAGQTAANNAGNFNTQAASAQAAGAGGVANAFGQFGQNYMLQSLLQGFGGSGGGGGGGADNFNPMPTGP